jgi:hypothetical protein
VTLAAGTRLGAYEILAPIGAGGMGEVYSMCETRPLRTGLRLPLSGKPLGGRRNIPA